MSRVHLLTGAGSGIGRALAQQLSDRGDRVLAVARSKQRADELAAELPAGCETLVVDLARPAQVEAQVSAQLEARPDLPLHSVVHCAGVVTLNPVADSAVEEWQHQLDVNLTAPAMLTKAVLPRLRATRGTVVLINSTSGLSASPQWAGYAASKHGLKALADSLRAEEATHGVRVTSVLPSRTATPMQEEVHRQEGRDYDPRRWILPETVAATVVHVLDLPTDATITDVVLRPAS